MRDLQRRLGAAGFAVATTTPGVYCPATAEAVSAFQSSRGLHADGVCGDQTWAALVEASYSLGDRVLYLRAPMLRGDDVAELQRQLGRLGFDAGRVDGIYGPDTVGALAEFQRNVGLDPDGIGGFDTVRALDRVGARHAHAQPVAALREHEQLLSAPRTLGGHRIVLGHGGGLATLARAASRSVRRAGATVITVDDPDESRHAAAANTFDATLYVGFVAGERAIVAYYAVAGFESTGGRRLAERLADALAPQLGVPLAAVGMRLPVLRETRMPAVLCELPSARIATDRSHDLAAVVVTTLSAWVAAPDPPVRTDRAPSPHGA